MDLKKAKQLDKEYVFSTYKRQPLLLVRGRGSKVWDSEDKVYLDFFSGLAVDNVGHCHPRVVQAIKHQAATLMHTSNLYFTEPQVRLAEKLNEIFGGKTFFANSGAEANEAAIKLARKWGHKHGDKFEIITMENSFHGRTLATITATGQTKYQKDFQPLVPGFKYAVFNNLASVEKIISAHTCALMVEPIQGEGGVNIGTYEFLKGLHQICQQNKILLIFDEVQTGMGRTGTFFAYQHLDFKPDMITLAKGLGGGLPIGVMMASLEIADIFTSGVHASTFGGNPVTCAAALAVIEILQEENLPEKAGLMGTYLLGKLATLEDKYRFIKDIRGRGLMVGIELDFPGDKIVEECRQQGLLLNCTADKVIRLLPPLIVGKKEINQAVKILDRVFSKVKELK